MNTEKMFKKLIRQEWTEGIPNSESILHFIPDSLKEILIKEKRDVFNLKIYKGIDNSYQNINKLNSEQYYFVGQVTQDGRLEGKGILLSFKAPDMYSLYKGYFENSRPTSCGMLVSKDRVYLGNFSDGNIEGKGTIKDIKNAWVYEGEISNNQPNGAGKIAYGNGEVYHGQFLRGEKSGTGVYEWNDGRRYKGKWLEDTMEGFGTFTWGDGRKYQGEFKNGVKDGKGKFLFSNGGFFEGKFKRGLEHGKGKIFKPGEGLSHGIWEYGRKRKNFIIRPSSFVFHGSDSFGMSVGDFRLHPENSRRVNTE